MFFIKKVVVYVLSITSLLLIHNALMAKTPVAILYDEIFLEHNTGSGHPERPERLFEVISTLVLAHSVTLPALLKPPRVVFSPTCVTSQDSERSEFQSSENGPSSDSLSVCRCLVGIATIQDCGAEVLAMVGSFAVISVLSSTADSASKPDAAVCVTTVPSMAP